MNISNRLRKAAPWMVLVLAWALMLSLTAVRHGMQSDALVQSAVTNPEAKVPRAPVPAAAPSRKEWREEQELRTQQQLAELARWSLIVSWAGLAITVAGSVFVGWTLMATREMNKITRDVGQAQVRCYPSIQKAWVSFYSRAAGKNDAVMRFPPGGRSYLSTDCPTIFFQIRNHGQSPAHKVRADVTIAYIYSYPSKQSGSRQSFFATDEHGEMISAGETIDRHYRFHFPLNETEKQAVNDPAGPFSVFAAVIFSFEDVFGEAFIEQWYFSAPVRNLLEEFPLKLTRMEKLASTSPIQRKRLRIRPQGARPTANR